ncbi:response regulator [Pseudomonas alloputida]|jgi:nucleoside phosphorylase/CheY-like chemotaxis protein|uniref:Response regulator n=1 Tax=Pseudomonas alloputida TaxID=1940621 RepID=A0ABY3D882_9PSED|nr:response regulator [Pseudomonas alloputida]TRZ61732.1 response regulator [Pseudomonas alloputida]
MAIKVLVVEDNPNKLASIVRELNLSGIPDEDIHSAENAVEARRSLNSFSYDLLLLDLILPSRTGAKESAETGLDLLRQIMEDGDLPPPRNIVGVTADEQALAEYEQEFRDLTVQILLYDSAKDGWRASLKHLLTSIKSSIANSKSYDYDICFITALRDPELTGVLALPVKWDVEESLGNGILFHRGVFVSGGVKIRLVCAHSNQMGPVAAAFMTRIIIENFKPKIVVMTGICGGIGSSVKLGDLIVAEKSWDWQCGKWLHDGTFEAAPDQKDASPELIGLARGMGEVVKGFHEAYVGDRPKANPAIIVGPMVSGSAVVENSELHSRFKMQHRKAVAVDMECYGVYYSSYMSHEPAPKYICMKAISDLSDKDKSDNIQLYCSHLSAVVAFKVAERMLT